MNATILRRRALHGLAMMLIASFATLFRADAVETVNVVQTTPVPRVITNVIEVRVPTNIFVNVYRTNQFEAFRTNVLDVFRTNWLARTLTNTITVPMTQTNVVTSYQTNVLTRYQTNLQTLALTNWENVLVFNTNWITKPVTNVVQIDATVGPTKAVPTVATIDSPVASATAATSAGALTLEASRTRKPPADDQVEVSFRLKASGEQLPVFASQEWQVQRTDGSVLLFAQGPEFKRELPIGSYKVEVRATPVGKTTAVRVRGFVEVMREEVVQEKPAVILGAR